MTEEIIIYLVFGILFSIGLMQLFLPEKVINFASNMYSKIGMKVDRRHFIWSQVNMRIMGLFYLSCTGFLFFTILQAR
ncbi:MAG: hypothetical protein NE327_19465 [Lentisphaeraceae bacterium]|nr:hypothetical protein [Lentisphaeraceae bacterium]